MNEFVTLAEKLTDALAQEDFSIVIKSFDDKMQSLLPFEKLQEIWQSLILQHGAFERRLATRTEIKSQYVVVFVTCQFKEFLLDIKIAINDLKQVIGLFFVPNQPAVEYSQPSYTKSELFLEKELLIGTGEWAVPGTLTIPANKASFDTLILVHGSGAHDRDESIGPNKPFRDLALGLASQGIAVLRYEKRTKSHASKFTTMKDKITVKEEIIDDAIAAVSMLKNSQEINAKRIFMLGHSLGGMLLPRIGSIEQCLSGFILMAAPSRPLEDVIFEQISYIVSLEKDTLSIGNLRLQDLKSQVTNVKSLQLGKKINSAELPLGIPTSYWLDLQKSDPLVLASKLRAPMLILHGERDYQVTMEDFKGWKINLSSNPNVKLKVYPKLNHLFIEGNGISNPGEYHKPGHIAEYVINDIANWIRQT